MQEEEIKRWDKDGGDKRFRYSYPLRRNSLVIDAGAYEGEWSKNIYEKYQCNIFAFEPVKRFFDKTRNNLRSYKKIKILRAGLSGSDRTEEIFLDGVSSSIYKKTSKPETIKMLDIKKFLQDNHINKVDLIKINIEGGEYELLERIIGTGLINKIDYIQVQFHNVIPDAEKRMQSIQRKLSETHRPTYQYWFIWDNWQKKGL